jgi:hypothetical protein
VVASWLIGRRRVAAGERPGWLGAWTLVAVDFAVLMAVFAVVFPPVAGVLADREVGVVTTILILFVLFFVPLQVVLITASMWASRSRWQDRPDKETER